ncbi:MAG: efflux RND transporter periplasmic adaptor subunit [Alphaproteobacteria bacterium]|nr:efflux RND transporter periplasmic adaptor subunit [Alphaproteobacteria bacterium]
MNLRNLAILTAFVLCSLSLDARAQDEVWETTVGLAAGREEPVSETAAVIGRFVSRQSGVVAAQSRGAVAEVLVEVGDRVTQGDPMVVLVADRLSLMRDLWVAQVRSAEAQLGAARAELALAQQELVRMESLNESAAFSQARFEDSQQRVAIGQAGVAEARADLLIAEFNLALVEDELGDATILAPYDAVVVRRHTEVGSYLDVGDDVVTLLNDGWVEIEADVPSNRVDGLPEGAVVQLRLDNGENQEAFVRAVGVLEDPQARTRPVRFTPAWVINVGTVAQGQSVTLMVPSGPQTDVITVHKDAVLRSGTETFVYVVVTEADMEAGTGVVEQRTVRLGDAIGNRFVVLGGVLPGDAIVVRGNEGLGDGSSVSFTP